MKLDRLVITSPSFSKHPVLMAEAKQICEHVIANDTGARMDEASIIEFIRASGAENLIIGTESLSRKVIDACSKLRRVGKYGVGCDNVDIDYLIERKIHFGFTAGVNRRSVSELVLAFMIGHQRNVFRSMVQMQAGRWEKFGGVELSGKTVGIIGFGHIGEDVAVLLRPFGVKLLVNDILDKSWECSKFEARQVELGDLLRNADIVSLHIPGGAATRNLINRSNLENMRKDSLLINTSRGSVVDFNEVCSAVSNRRIAGYASDVFPAEPMHQDRLTVEQGFYFTPHIGGNSNEAIVAMGRAAIRGLLADPSITPS